MTDPTAPPVLSPQEAVETFVDKLLDVTELRAEVARLQASLLDVRQRKDQRINELIQQLTAHDKEQATDIIELVRQIEAERAGKRQAEAEVARLTAELKKLRAAWESDDADQFITAISDGGDTEQ